MNNSVVRGTDIIIILSENTLEIAFYNNTEYKMSFADSSLEEFTFICLNKKISETISAEDFNKINSILNSKLLNVSTDKSNSARCKFTYDLIDMYIYENDKKLIIKRPMLYAEDKGKYDRDRKDVYMGLFRAIKEYINTREV